MTFCPACEARRRRQVEAAARARRARVAALSEERDYVVAELRALWRRRPELRENASAAAHALRLHLGLPAARERSLRRLAGLIQNGQNGTDTTSRG